MLTVRAAAKRLNRCEEMIRRYIRRGLLRATRPTLHRSRGGNYLIPESALADFLATQRDISQHSNS